MEAYVSDSHELTADIFIDSRLPSADEQSLVDSFAALGVVGRVKVVPVRRSTAQGLTWLALVVLPLKGFLTSVGGNLAADALRKLTSILRRGGLVQSEDSQVRPILLQDASTGLQIVLEAGLPQESITQLVSLDLSQYRIGPVHYDRAQRRWRSELDEALDER